MVPRHDGGRGSGSGEIGCCHQKSGPDSLAVGIRLDAISDFGRMIGKKRKGESAGGGEGKKKQKGLGGGGGGGGKKKGRKGKKGKKKGGVKQPLKIAAKRMETKTKTKTETTTTTTTTTESRKTVLGKTKTKMAHLPSSLLPHIDWSSHTQGDPSIIHAVHNRKAEDVLTREQHAEYQRQSLKGGSTFDAYLWVQQVLLRRGSTEGKRLLDVGAIHANRYVPDSHPLLLGHSKAIDLHVLQVEGQGDNGVVEADFLELDPQEEGFYDYVVLSLVANFEPDPRKRGQMLIQANALLRSSASSGNNDAESSTQAGEETLCFFVLPRACFDKSRYLDVPTFTALCKEAGFAIEEATTTDRLALFVLSKVSDPLGNGFSRRKVRPFKGAFNNFAMIIAKPPGRSAGSGGPGGGGGKSGFKSTPASRRKARKRARRLQREREEAREEEQQ